MHISCVATLEMLTSFGLHSVTVADVSKVKPLGLMHINEGGVTPGLAEGTVSVKPTSRAERAAAARPKAFGAKGIW